MANKLKIKANIVAWDSWEMDGKLPDIILKLQKQITDNPNFFNFEIEVKSESEYYGACSTSITISAFRWETDEEYANRIILAEQSAELKRLTALRNAEANEKRERSLYESLKKKFEKEINEKV